MGDLWVKVAALKMDGNYTYQLNDGVWTLWKL